MSRRQRCLERMGSEVQSIVFTALRRWVFKDKLKVMPVVVTVQGKGSGS